MDESLAKLAARAEVYRLLSQAYYTPQANFFKGDFLGLFKKAFDTLSLDPCIPEVTNMEFYLQAPQEPVELGVEYTRLFRGPVQAEAYPYESMYIEGEVMGKSTLDVVRRYGDAGVGVSEEFKDLPDHISAELEFMHYLCAKEFEARQREDRDEVSRFHIMGSSFLRDHLARWVPQLSEHILQHATTPYYLSLARMTREFVSREVAEA